MSQRSALFGRIPPSLGGGLMVACGVSIFGVTDSLTLAVSDAVGVGQFHFSRSLLAAAVLLAIARVTSISIMPRIWWAVGLKTFFITASMMVYFSVLPTIPLAEAGAGLFTSPIFVMLFSWMFWGERIGLGKILAVAIGSIGVLLVIRPGGEGFTPYHLMPVLAGALLALNSIATYRYCKQETALALSMAFFVAIGIAGAVFASILTAFPVPAGLYADAPFLFRGWAGVDPVFWLVLLGIAVAAISALTLVNRAYQTTQTSFAIIFEYFYLIAIGLSGWLLWDAVPDGLSVVGIVLIVVAGVVVTGAQRLALRSVAGTQE